MDIKKTYLIIAIILFFTPCVWAGQTTITGTASCVMPDLFELKTAPLTEISASKDQIPVPLASGASGQYEIRKDEKMIQTEEDKTHISENGKTSQVIVYTICAK